MTPNGTLHIRHIKLWLKEINAQPQSKLNFLMRRSIVIRRAGLQTKDCILCQKKQPSTIRRPRNIIRMPRVITVKQPNITKAGGTNKRGIMHTPPGATRFTLEITPKKLLKPTWRHTARNSC
jgi:hypothetical protein